MTTAELMQARAAARATQFSDADMNRLRAAAKYDERFETILRHLCDIADPKLYHSDRANSCDEIMIAAEAMREEYDLLYAREEA